MYNLTVANDHTYFVGVGGVLGHNSDYCSKILVNEQIVKKALANSSYRTHQKSISIPKISRLVHDMINGKIRPGGMPSIKVDGNIIIEGNHRYVAAQIANFSLDIQKGTLAGYKKRQISHSVRDLVLDAIDWGD